MPPVITILSSAVWTDSGKQIGSLYISGLGQKTKKGELEQQWLTLRAHPAHQPFMCIFILHVCFHP